MCYIPGHTHLEVLSSSPDDKDSPSLQGPESPVSVGVYGSLVRSSHKVGYGSFSGSIGDQRYLSVAEDFQFLYAKIKDNNCQSRLSN